MLKFKNTTRNSKGANRERTGQRPLFCCGPEAVKAIAESSGNQTTAIVFGLWLSEAVTGNSPEALSQAATLAGITPRELRRLLRVASRKPAQVKVEQVTE